MSTAISGRIALLRLRTSTPDMSESDRSTRATSNGVERTAAIASSPVRASPATSMSTRPENTCFSPIRTTSWSSTISSRIMLCESQVFVAMSKWSHYTRRFWTGASVTSDLLVGRFLQNSILKGVLEGNAILPDGNVFALQPRQLGHERAGRLVDDAPAAGVVTKRGLPRARPLAGFGPRVDTRKQLGIRLVEGHHEGREAVGLRGRRFQRGLGAQLEVRRRGRVLGRGRRGGGGFRRGRHGGGGEREDEELHFPSPPSPGGFDAPQGPEGLMDRMLLLRSARVCRSPATRAVPGRHPVL